MDRPPRGPRRPSRDGSNSLNRARDTVSVSVPEGEDCNRRPLSAADATTTRQLAPRPAHSCCSARCRRSSCTAALLTSTSTEMETGPSTRFVGCTAAALSSPPLSVARMRVLTALSRAEALMLATSRAAPSGAPRFYGLLLGCAIAHTLLNIVTCSPHLGTSVCMVLHLISEPKL